MHALANRRAVAAISVPAVLGGLLGAVVALLLPRGDQGDVLDAAR